MSGTTRRIKVDSARFPKSARLSKASEFRKLKNEGRAQQGRYMILSALQSGENAPARAGFITSRRVGCAVERNLVRRRLREIFRTHRGHLAHGHWLVVVARRAAVEASFAELESEWLRLARRAHIIHP